MARIRLSLQAEPNTPPTGFATLFINESGSLCVKTDDGTVQSLGNVSSPDSPSENAIARFTSAGGLKDSAVSVNDTGDLSTAGQGIFASISVGNGASGTFTSQDSKTVTVTNGVITSIV